MKTPLVAVTRFGIRGSQRPIRCRNGRFKGMCSAEGTNNAKRLNTPIVAFLEANRRNPYPKDVSPIFPTPPWSQDGMHQAATAMSHCLAHLDEAGVQEPRFFQASMLSNTRLVIRVDLLGHPP